MNRYLALTIIPVLLASGTTKVPDPVRLRTACVRAGELPKIIIPLDIKRLPSGGWPDISMEQFHLMEDGRRGSTASRIMKFHDTNMGLAMIVALDASGSMNGRPMRAIQEGLAQLVNRKRKEDRVAVLSFADDTRWETKWDSSEQVTKDAFRSLQTRGNLTRLYDALVDARKAFEAQAEKDSSFPLRRSILVISDGHDEGSQTSLSQLLEDVTRSRIRIDTVGLARSSQWLGNLRQISKAGFGESQAVSSPEALSKVLSLGIDSLLDMPALEFQTEDLRRDGEKHQAGIEYRDTYRDQMAVTLPAPFWRETPVLYAIFTIVPLVAIAALLIWRRRSPRPAAWPVPAPPKILNDVKPNLPPPVMPIRVPTLAEPAYEPRAMYAAQASAPVISYEASGLPDNPPNRGRIPTLMTPNLYGPPPLLNLTAIAGPYTGQAFAVTVDDFWIGSEANNNLCLNADPGVSGNHACIRREQLLHRVYDNDSLNDTFVNGKPIGTTIALLQPGDRIRVGNSEFRAGEQSAA